MRKFPVVDKLEPVTIIKCDQKVTFQEKYCGTKDMKERTPQNNGAVFTEWLQAAIRKEKLPGMMTRTEEK